MFSSSLLFLALTASAIARPRPSKTIERRQAQGDIGTTQFVNWPLSYIALGDSFAAGIGAGHFYNPSDIENKKCKRFDQSYPVVAMGTPFMSQAHADFSFLACSGAKLPDLDSQFEKLGEKRANIVSLSISGNDFAFSNVVIKCVYNQAWLDSSMEKECNQALDDGEAKLNNDDIWRNFTSNVQRIMDNHMTQDGPDKKATSVLVLTGK
jgi:hypothetical protein